MAFIYTGVGSRKTPEEVLVVFNKLAKSLAKHGFILRSGHSDGADMAFENGCDAYNGKKEIYLPWRSFRGSDSELYHVSSEAIMYTCEHHVNPEVLNQTAIKLLSRNVHQLLGEDMSRPSDFMICWTKRGKLKGGTGYTIKVARQHGIKIFNAGEYEDLNKFVEDIKNHLIENNMLKL